MPFQPEPANPVDYLPRDLQVRPAAQGIQGARQQGSRYEPEIASALEELSDFIDAKGFSFEPW